MSTLSDKVAVVTGASSGIGRAIAELLGKRGARVVCAARREDRLTELAEQIKANGGHAIKVACDVAERSQVDALCARAREVFGPVDVMINNAGVMPLSFLSKTRVDEWDQMVDVNIKGVMYGCAAVLPEMLERGAGDIVNVSSIAGKKVIPGGAVYCGTKHFVHAFTEGLRQETAGLGVRVINVAPGLVRTELADSIEDEQVIERFKQYEGMEALTSEDIAVATLQALEAPRHVGLNEVVIRPSAQAM